MENKFLTCKQLAEVLLQEENADALVAVCINDGDKDGDYRLISADGYSNPAFMQATAGRQTDFKYPNEATDDDKKRLIKAIVLYGSN